MELGGWFSKEIKIFGKTLKIGTLLIIVIGLFFVTGASALWIGTWTITGSVISSDGGYAEEQICNLDLSDLPTGNTTKPCSYINPDGDAEFEFSEEYDIISTNASCNFEFGKDLDIWLDNSSIAYDVSNTPKFDLSAGNNTMYVRVSINSASCPFSGSYNITGVTT